VTTNDIIGDPAPGHVKELIVTVDNQTLNVKEGQLLVYPP